MKKLKRAIEKGVSLTEVHCSIEEEESVSYISEGPYYMIGSYPLSVSFEQEVFQFSIEYRVLVEFVKRDYGYEAVIYKPVDQIQIRRLKIHLNKIFYVHLSKGEKDKLSKAIERGLLIRKYTGG